jgi:uncharacterized membrane protein YedE/YeeE
MPNLLLTNLPPIHWAFAGAAIAAITLTMLALANRRLGISSTFEDVCSLALATPYFQRKAIVGGRPWRLPFAAGLVLGGLLSAHLGGGWSPTMALGMFDTVVGFGPVGKLTWMFVGGLFIGFGTRLANGCTSGHGIFGMSNLEPASFVTTVAFMVGGIVTTHLVYRVLFA